MQPKDLIEKFNRSNDCEIVIPGLEYEDGSEVTVTLSVNSSTIGLHSRLSEINRRMLKIEKEHVEWFNITTQEYQRLFEEHNKNLGEAAISLEEFALHFFDLVPEGLREEWLKSQEETNRLRDEYEKVLKSKFMALVKNGHEYVEILEIIPFEYPNYFNYITFLTRIEYATPRRIDPEKK
ncbi:hypothetical protein [Leptospira stimsonii]|uniref:Uncharacterized protein n=1 Tax=Leptospira stimsonii TaxID=2202203 RepID=A0ABY2N919_9LEPT|nr:hypothetical protein [Leptospira stimsonii]TGK12798.1 hypothetical protein EHO98_19345 [Leptospira stimsonii]TGM18786.1 hypothetical protein EHQ90_06355 [Leptospira stimsonii]